MEQSDKARIHLQWTPLTRDIPYGDISGALIEKGILDSDEHKRIKTIQNDIEKMEEVLHIILKGGPKTYSTFVSVLDSNAHTSWDAELLQQTQIDHDISAKESSSQHQVEET